MRSDHDVMINGRHYGPTVFVSHPVMVWGGGFRNADTRQDTIETIARLYRTDVRTARMIARHFMKVGDRRRAIARR